ncbi:formate dehydrogenase accessory sulfurtransferase FdhD [Thermobifida alba]|uniref:Sulfur carrier protein FdhD n=1 Tax=Thermobifida alba TaxID=53522 RepID=A0ABY4L1E4_THEAE|nr:formate dehydrogenase accessory sulfurtransferase FdhD [Thermobifida alba]UPT20751.1 formate dehydrogenase accessory sulfurtransferase FdhD [Thermobifida alba]
MGRVTARVRVRRISGSSARDRLDTLVVEEPLEMRVGGRALTVTMRTPGHDFEMVTGFLIGEGLVADAADVHSLRYCAGATEDGVNTYNVIDVVLAPGVPPPDVSAERRFATTSSCGVCGKTSLEAVRTRSRFTVADDDVRFSTGVLAALPDRLRAAQKLFERTGGLHAAALATPDGDLLCVREDIGRHNAVDKVVGHAAARYGLPLRGTGLLVSGRASFELTQKALMAGIPLLAAVSAPSSLAVELAAQSGMSLVGFLRGDSMNVYAGAHRVVD